MLINYPMLYDPRAWNKFSQRQCTIPWIDSLEKTARSSLSIRDIAMMMSMSNLGVPSVARFRAKVFERLSSQWAPYKRGAVK